MNLNIYSHKQHAVTSEHVTKKNISEDGKNNLASNVKSIRNIKGLAPQPTMAMKLGAALIDFKVDPEKAKAKWLTSEPQPVLSQS